MIFMFKYVWNCEYYYNDVTWVFGCFRLETTELIVEQHIQDNNKEDIKSSY